MPKIKDTSVYTDENYYAKKCVPMSRKKENNQKKIAAAYKETRKRIPNPFKDGNSR